MQVRPLPPFKFKKGFILEEVKEGEHIGDK